MPDLSTCPVLAMHLSEGILPGGWAAFWWLAALPFVVWGLWCAGRRRREDPRATTLIALVGAAVFVISCMPIPIPWLGTCAHPCGTGLAALVIGTGPTVVVAAIALAFQALLLAHGGLSTLGANLFSMGIVGALAAVAVFRLARGLRAPPVVAAFLAGLVCDWATYATTSLQLSAALCSEGSLGKMFLAVLCAFVPTQVPLGIGEGFLTARAYRFVMLRRPELLSSGRIVAGLLAEPGAMKPNAEPTGPA
jgi:cobalt/nickel transport system permease protein